MTTNFPAWSIAFFKDGRRGEPILLGPGTTTLGRDESNTISLPDASVSRIHAELVPAADGLILRDCKSRNGVRVNAVPRQHALLQKGDVVEIGIYTFEATLSPAALPRQKSRVAPVPAEAVSIEQTAARRLQLPDLKQDRHLSALYHVCYWITEDVAKPEKLPRLLELLLEGFRASEVQLYSESLELQCAVAANEKQRAIKLAPFLAKRCQAASEAIVFCGKDMGRHQQRAGQFNYLVGPLSPSQDRKENNAFVVITRPTEWEDFTNEDRVLLQAICQLWVRGQGKAQQLEDLKQENATLKQQTHTPTLLGNSDVMNKLRDRLRKVATTNATVLISGETGSGKELVANFIHQHSPRADRPFVKVNCAAVPEGLIESELFGHAKGAFTDAKSSYEGKFAQANGGTLFLDEIGEMPLVVQSKVLRALENGEIERIGQEGSTKVDVRIIASTHRDLAKMVQQGRFREDLFYRLNVLTVTVPPLREHAEDIPMIALHFLESFCLENGLAELRFAKDAAAVLSTHQWPGNARELRNVVQRCATEAENLVIKAADLKEHVVT